MNTILPEAPDGTSDQVSTKPGEVHYHIAIGRAHKGQPIKLLVADKDI